MGCDYPVIEPTPSDPVAVFADAVIDALNALPNPRECSGMFRKEDWATGRDDCASAVAAALTQYLGVTS